MAQSSFLTPFKGVNTAAYANDQMKGQGEILLNSTTFRFDGETYPRDLHLPAEHWSLKGLVDVGGDGFEDLVWQNVSTGRVVVWNLNQWANVSKVTILHPGGAWQLEDVRDDNNDGTLDYVWKHRTSGKEAVWFTDAKRRITSFEIR